MTVIITLSNLGHYSLTLPKSIGDMAMALDKSSLYTPYLPTLCTQKNYNYKHEIVVQFYTLVLHSPLWVSSFKEQTMQWNALFTILYHIISLKSYFFLLSQLKGRLLLGLPSRLFFIWLNFIFFRVLAKILIVKWFQLEGQILKLILKNVNIRMMTKEITKVCLRLLFIGIQC